MFDQGMAFLRTGWKHGDTLLSMNNLRTITGHGHRDRNSIILDYRGEELLLDPGMIAYGDPNSRLYHSTFCHNTLTFSQGDQSPQRQCLENGIRHFLHMSGDTCPGLDGSIDWVSTDASQAYDEAELFLRHILFLRPGIFVLIDEVRAKQPEQTEINFTCLGPLEGEGPAFVSRAVRNTLSIHSQASEPVGHSFKNWGTTWPDVPSYRLIRRTEGPVDRVTFMTVLVPQPKERPLPAIEPLRTREGLGVRIQCEEQNAIVIFQNQQQQVSIDEMSSDARIAAVNLVHESPRAAVMLDGTTFRLQGQEILEGDGAGLLGSMKRTETWEVIAEICP
jgi:hypothetical protein